MHRTHRAMHILVFIVISHKLFLTVEHTRQVPLVSIQLRSGLPYPSYNRCPHFFLIICLRVELRSSSNSVALWCPLYSQLALHCISSRPSPEITDEITSTRVLDWNVLKLCKWLRYLRDEFFTTASLYTIQGRRPIKILHACYFAITCHTMTFTLTVFDIPISE